MCVLIYIYKTIVSVVLDYYGTSKFPSYQIITHSKHKYPQEDLNIYNILRHEHAEIINRVINLLSKTEIHDKVINMQ